MDSTPLVTFISALMLVFATVLIVYAGAMHV